MPLKKRAEHMLRCWPVSLMLTDHWWDFPLVDMRVQALHWANCVVMFLRFTIQRLTHCYRKSWTVMETLLRWENLLLLYSIEPPTTTHLSRRLFLRVESDRSLCQTCFSNLCFQQTVWSTWNRASSKWNIFWDQFSRLMTVYLFSLVNSC